MNFENAGLVALGFVLIYRATELVNFAQGDLLMLGAFTCYMLVVWYGIGYWPAFALSIVILGLFGALLDRIVLRRVLSWSRLSEQLFRVDKWSVCRG